MVKIIRRITNQHVVNEIVKLVKDHKKRCSGIDCSISLAVVGIGCRRLLKKSLSKEEREVLF